jgi:hypothetical protein
MGSELEFGISIAHEKVSGLEFRDWHMMKFGISIAHDFNRGLK